MKSPVLFSEFVLGMETNNDDILSGVLTKLYAMDENERNTFLFRNCEDVAEDILSFAAVKGYERTVSALLETGWFPWRRAKVSDLWFGHGGVRNRCGNPWVSLLASGSDRADILSMFIENGWSPVDEEKEGEIPPLVVAMYAGDACLERILSEGCSPSASVWVGGLGGAAREMFPLVMLTEEILDAYEKDEDVSGKWEMFDRMSASLGSLDAETKDRMIEEFDECVSRFPLRTDSFVMIRSRLEASLSSAGKSIGRKPSKGI